MPVSVKQRRRSRRPTQPLEKVVIEPQHLPETQGNNPLKSTRHAIVIEDESAYRELLIDLFDKHGYKTLHASCGDDAQELASRLAAQPVIIAVDDSLPDMLGVELARILRAWFPEARIIFLTSYGDPEKLYDAFRSGCTASLVKPHGFKDLPRYLELLERDPTALDQLVFDNTGVYYME